MALQDSSCVDKDAFICITQFCSLKTSFPLWCSWQDFIFSVFSFILWYSSILSMQIDPFIWVYFYWWRCWFLDIHCCDQQQLLVYLLFSINLFLVEVGFIYMGGYRKLCSRWQKSVYQKSKFEYLILICDVFVSPSTLPFVQFNQNILKLIQRFNQVSETVILFRF